MSIKQMGVRLRRDIESLFLRIYLGAGACGNNSGARSGEELLGS